MSEEIPSIRSAALWVIAGRITGIGATIVSNVLAARLLGPAEFGVYLLTTTIMALGALVAVAGFDQAALRFISESLAIGRPELARRYLRRAAAGAAITSFAAAVLLVGIMSLYPALATRWHQPWLLLGLSAIGVLALAWQQLAAESLRGWHELRLASLFSGGQTGGPVSNVLLLAALGVAAWTLRGLKADLAVMLLVGSVAITAPVAWLCLWMTSSRSRDPSHESHAAALSAEQKRQLWVVSGSLFAIQALTFVSYQLDIWIGGALLSESDLGLYGAAKRSLLLAQMPVQMAMSTVLATVPHLHARQRTAELERVLRRAATLAAIPSLGALAALTLFPGAVLHLVFGGSFTGAAPTIVALAVGQLALVLFGNPAFVLSMTGRHRIVIGIFVLSALMSVAGSTVGAAWFGAVGLAAGSAASLVLLNGLAWWFCHRSLGVWTHVGSLNLLRPVATERCRASGYSASAHTVNAPATEISLSERQSATSSTVS